MDPGPNARSPASGKRVVVRDGLSHWQPDSGQFLLNFDTKQILQPARFKAPRREQPSQAEAALKWFERAMALQTDSRDEARRAYQEALRLQPAFVEAHRLSWRGLYHGKLETGTGLKGRPAVCEFQTT